MKKYKMIKTNLLPIFILLVLYNCASLTPSQRVLWGLNVYQAQYRMYLDQVIAPDLSEEQKAVLRKDPSLITGKYINQNLTEDQKKILNIKKDILIELKPLVLMAAEYNETGQLPPEDIQNKLTRLINKLVELSEK